MSNCNKCKYGCLIEGSQYCFHGDNIRVESSGGVYKTHLKKLDADSLEGSCGLYDEGNPVSESVDLVLFYSERFHALLRDGVDEKGEPLRNLNPKLVDNKGFLKECFVPYTDHGNNADGFIKGEVIAPLPEGTFRSEKVKKAVHKFVASREGYRKWVEAGKTP